LLLWHRFAKLRAMGLELLSGVREKVLRAGEHLYVFENEVARYAELNPYRIVQDFEDHIPEKSGRPGLTWRASIDPPPPRLRLAIIAGDVLYGLRSALEHLAWALILQNGGEPSDSNPATQFPIFLTAPANPPLTIRARSGGPGTAAETVLEMLQPYNGGNDPSLHPLWLLRTLSNIDKHRTLNVVTLDLGRVVMRFTNGMTSYAVRRDVEDGTMIVWLLQEAESFDPDVKVEADFSPSIAFLDAPGVGLEPFVPAADLLVSLLQFTRDSVIQRFARTCFGGELTF
jgi:hypothetical protein